MRSPIVAGALALAALAGGIVAGCDLQFTDPFGTVPSELMSDLRIVDGEPRTIRFSGQLLPGRDRHGEPRPVQDEGLGILDLWLQPDRIGNQGLRSYVHEWVLSPGAALPEPRLRAPRVQAAQGENAGLVFGVCSRTEADERVIVPGDTLHFAIACADSVDARRHTEWDLTVRRADSGGLVMALHANSKPPPSIAILADWLEQPDEPALEATLTVFEKFVRNDAPGDDYRIALDVRWVFRWAIRWKESPEGGDGPEGGDTPEAGDL